jgi:hypothetical protein
MKLFQFILGVLGILLIIGAFSSFIPLLLLGGIATGSFAFAFGFPIFLMVLGAAMVYFGFYYKGATHKSNSQLIDIGKWGLIYTVAILLANYIISKIIIFDTFLVILFTATIVSIVVQVIKSHEYKFKFNWFIFYFLIYANLIWAMGEFILPKVAFQTGFFSSVVIGFTLAGVVAIIQRLRIRRDSILWVSIILVMLLLVGNLDSLQLSPIKQLLEQSSNSTELSEDKQICPTALEVISYPVSEAVLNPISIRPSLNKMIDNSIWRIEGDIRSCYNGKFKGQYPDWFYCDDMIVSRWETSSSGTIRYRWYTAVTAEWKPEGKNSRYVFDDFSCENGKKVTVDKETTAYYVHVSRDGTEIKVEY